VQEEHETEDASASNVTIEILYSSLQAIGGSPVKKKWLQEKMYPKEKDLENHQCSKEKSYTCQQVEAKKVHLLVLVQKS
jgi:hypothetical protein